MKSPQFWPLFSSLLSVLKTIWKVIHLTTIIIILLKITIPLSLSSLSLSRIPMSPILSSHSVVFATAMAAFSAGTLIILALRHQKIQFQANPIRVLRPCLSSGERRGEKRKKKKVRFAKDVVDPTGDSQEFRRQHNLEIKSKNRGNQNRGSQNRGMPANRAALYNGMLRDRVIHRIGYSY